MTNWNNASLKKHLSEGLVIVLSILLALYAEASWQAHKDRLEESEILADLKVEFAEAENEIQRDINARKIIMIQAEVLSHFVENPDVDLPLDSLRQCIRAFDAWRFYTPSHPVLDDIQSSGRISLIQSDSVRYSLTFYGQERARIQVIDESERQVVINHIEPFLISKIDLNLLFNKDLNTEKTKRLHTQLNRLIRSPDVGSMLYLRKDRTERAISYSTRLLEQIRLVQEVLSKD